MLKINEVDLRNVIKEEIKIVLKEIKMGIHNPRAEEYAEKEAIRKAQDTLHALDVILSQFQSIHSGQTSRQAVNKARANAKIVYDFVKGRKNREAQGMFPPHEVINMARGLAKNPEETVEKYVRPILNLKKKIKSSI